MSAESLAAGSAPDDYDRRTELLLDQGIITPHDLNRASTRASKHGNNNASRALRSERWVGGRPPKDSGLDPNWNVLIPPLSPEQQEINRRGIALCRAVLAEARRGEGADPSPEGNIQPESTSSQPELPLWD